VLAITGRIGVCSSLDTGSVLQHRQNVSGVSPRVEALSDFFPLRTGGVYVVSSASTVACVDVFSDFVGLRWRLGADAACATTAGITGRAGRGNNSSAAAFAAGGTTGSDRSSTTGEFPAAWHATSDHHGWRQA
jgi:hypothetical protein